MTTAFADDGMRVDRAHTVQTRILLAGTAVYFAYSFQFVRGYPFRLLLGAVVIAALYALSQRAGPNHKPGMEPILGFLVSVAAFAMPVAAGPSPRGHGFIAAAIGSFVAQGAWALHRYPFEPTRSAKWFVFSSLFDRVTISALIGAGLAVLLTLYAAVVVAIAAVADKSAVQPLLTDFVLLTAGYFGGGILGGALVGALAPIVRWPLGAMVLGIPLTGAIYGSVGIAMERMETLNDGADPTTIPLSAAIVILAFIGPMWGIMAKEWIEG